MINDHDPFTDPKQAHPRARELMTEDFFWDCVNELAPFGSDEGWEAYSEYRRWRTSNPDKNLLECIQWILLDKYELYNENLLTDDVVKQHYNNPDLGGLGIYTDMFTLDTTIIATVLGQLVDEGRIDSEVKPFAEIAVSRQSHPIVASAESIVIMKAIRRVINEA